jgi:NADPH-dependent 7-cyano-7-deazaguanine reductase QueF
MTCNYELKVRAKCPVDGSEDIYDFTLRSTKMYTVESLLALMEPFAEMKVFQEDLTKMIADDLGCEAISVGVHSGVKVTVRATPGDSKAKAKS